MQDSLTEPYRLRYESRKRGFGTLPKDINVVSKFNIVNIPSPKRQNTSPKLSFTTTIESQESLHHVTNDKLEQEPPVKVTVETSKLISQGEIADYEEIDNNAPLMEIEEVKGKKLKDDISQRNDKEKESENDDDQKHRSPQKLILPISPSETTSGVKSVIEDYTNDTTPLTKPLHDLKITDDILINDLPSSPIHIPIEIDINNTLPSKEIHKNEDSVDQGDEKATTMFNNQEQQHNQIVEESSQQSINVHDNKYARQEVSLDDIYDSQYDDNNSISSHNNNKGINDSFNNSNASTTQTTLQLDQNIRTQYNGNVATGLNNNNKVVNDLFNNDNNVSITQVPAQLNNNTNTQQNDSLRIGSSNSNEHMDHMFNHCINDNCATSASELKERDIPLPQSSSSPSQPDMNGLSNDSVNVNKNKIDQTLKQLDYNIQPTLQSENDQVFKPVEINRLDDDINDHMDIEYNNQSFGKDDLPNKNSEVTNPRLEQKKQGISASESGSSPLQFHTDSLLNNNNSINSDKTQISETKEQDISSPLLLQSDSDSPNMKNNNSNNSNDTTQVPELLDSNNLSVSKSDNDINGKAIEEEGKKDGVLNNLKNTENDDNQYFEMDYDDNDHQYDDGDEGHMEEQINEEENGDNLDNNNNSSYEYNNIAENGELDAEIEQHIQEYMNVEQLEEKRNQLKEDIRPEILDYFKDKQLPDDIEEIDTDGLLKHLERNIEGLLKPSDRKKLSDEILSTDASITKVTFDFKNKLQNPDSKRLVEAFGLKLTHQLHTQFKLYTELKQLEMILKKIRRQHSTTRSKAQSLKVECDKYTKQLESKKNAFRKLQKSRKTLNEYESFFKEIQDALLE